MKILIHSLLLIVIWCYALSLTAQSLETEIRVYDLADGLSHRNVFKIQQDDKGIIWIATINGLNAFTGYGFEKYNSNSSLGKLPNDLVSDFLILPNDQLLLASPDFLSTFSTIDQSLVIHQVKPGEIVRREALTPYNLAIDGNRIWCTVYDERNGQNWLGRFESNQLDLLRGLTGSGTKRPLINWRGKLFFAESDNQLTLLNEDGTIKAVESIGGDATAENAHNIIALQERNNKLWILFDDGRIYYKPAPGAPAQKWLAGPPIKASDRVESFWVEENQDIWVGGFGLLWQYDSKENIWRSFDEPIRQQLKNTCTYRQIFQDSMGITWLSTDFGAIKINQADRLFGSYLSGGSEYCSNIYCSMRGITEDDDGNVYLAYYNSIHVLKPDEQTVRPLFPKNDFFNFPFGITSHENYLYTGNGIRINLKSLQRDQLFPTNDKDLGAVIVDKYEELWFGYEHELYNYDPQRSYLSPYEDSQGQWDSLYGTICQLYESPFSDDIWVGTMDNGAVQIKDGKERALHYSNTESSTIKLPHNQVNAICETTPNELWLGTARGLLAIDKLADTSYLYTTKDGLPNDYINGILPEGDSCLWISTDNGLCRLSFKTATAINFFVEDGLTANEFNRTSYFRSQSGKLYFGGLNGVNVLLPSKHYLEYSMHQRTAPLVLATFSYLDGQQDSMLHKSMVHLKELKPIELSHHDRMFNIQVALLDFRRPEEHQFQFYLEGYENDWSEVSNESIVRYTDLDPGDYLLHVRARTSGEDWNPEELTIPISIRPAIYQRAWFLPLLILLGVGLIGGIMQYRLHLVQKRRLELETEVALRTRELAEEKQKSEELLLNILPAGLAEELKQNGFAKAKRHEQVSVMFSDFKGFTKISELLEPEELVAEIDHCFRAFDEITERHGLEKIKTIGDAYLLVGGISEKAEDQAKRVVLAALEIQEFMSAIAVERKLNNQHFFEARIGIHTGPLVAGIVGIKKFAYDIWGDTVNVASRMETNGSVGKVNLSSRTYELVKEDFRCAPNGRYSENNTDVKMYLVEEYLGPNIT